MLLTSMNIAKTSCRALLQRARACSVARHGPATARCISSTSRGESPSGGPANPGAQTVERPFTSIPPASWSLHDLQLLQEDRAKGDTHAISKEELGKLASYAHLDLNNSPVAQDGGEALQRDLDSILGCMRILQSAELSVGAEALETTPGSPKAAPLREDVVKEGGDVEAVLSNAGKTERQQFVAPKTGV